MSETSEPLAVETLAERRARLVEALAVAHGCVTLFGERVEQYQPCGLCEKRVDLVEDRAIALYRNRVTPPSSHETRGGAS